jgi:8-oxo-dGTP pyrophosphatase MutT (NUDIX family)
MSAPSQKNFRPAVRALVVDQHKNFLMVRLVFPHGTWWVLPGGGIDADEDHITALHRELNEEVGLTNATIGPVLWTRVHEFSMTDTAGVVWNGQEECVYLVETTHFAVAPGMTTEQLRAENLHEHKWWSVDELSAYTGSDNFAPPTLHMLVRNVIANGAPLQPPHIHQVGTEVVSIT